MNNKLDERLNLVLKELKHRKHKDYAIWFYQPVDWQQLGLDDYPLVVKQPMDLFTMQQKLNKGLYPTAELFQADMNLMFNNCFAFNPPQDPVHQCGKRLQQVFKLVWKRVSLDQISMGTARKDENREFSKNKKRKLEDLEEPKQVDHLAQTMHVMLNEIAEILETTPGKTSGKTVLQSKQQSPAKEKKENINEESKKAQKIAKQKYWEEFKRLKISQLIRKDPEFQSKVQKLLQVIAPELEVNYTYSWPINIVERIFTEIPENNAKNNSNNNVISSSKRGNSQPSPQPVQEINNTTTTEVVPTTKEKSQEILELELEQHALEMQAAMRRRLQKQQQPSHPITPPYKEKPVIEKKKVAKLNLGLGAAKMWRFDCKVGFSIRRPLPYSTRRVAVPAWRKRERIEQLVRAMVDLDLKSALAKV